MSRAMRRFPLCLLTLATFTATALAGCAWLPKPKAWVEISPVSARGSSVASNDRDYSLAVAAIDRRDYAKALDYLQVARAADPRDARIMNAFGVVYDKLGRFDLSARYYAQAKDLDPDSEAVANNIAYSQALQTRAVTAQTFAATPAAPDFAPSQTAALSATPVPATPKTGPVVRLGATAPSVLVVKAGLTGRPLTVINATGATRGAETIRAALAAKGWSAPTRMMSDGPRQTRTTIVYAPASEREAAALARTLNRPVVLARCEKTCAGIRLTVAADALAWSRPRSSAIPRTG